MSVSNSSSFSPAPVASPGYSQYLTTPAIAGIGMMPFYYGLEDKSKLQTGLSPAVRSLRQKVSAGFTPKVPVTVGAIVGGQLLLQQGIESRIFSKQPGIPLPLSETVASSAAVALVTSPALAVFNGYTTGKTIGASFRELSIPQVRKIVGKETAFVVGVSSGEWVAEQVKKHAEIDPEQKVLNKVVDYTAAGVSGALGSVGGHPFDTGLTRLQNNPPLAMLSIKDSFKAGLVPRTKAVAGLSLAIKVGKDVVDYVTNSPK